MPSFTSSAKLGLLRDLKAFFYLKTGVTRGMTPDEQTRLLEQAHQRIEGQNQELRQVRGRVKELNQDIDRLSKNQTQNDRLAKANLRALANRPLLKPGYEYRPISTHSSDFQALKKEFPYFGYINVEVEDVRPFLMFSSNDDRVAQTYFYYGANAFESLSLRIMAGAGPEIEPRLRCWGFYRRVLANGGPRERERPGLRVRAHQAHL